MKASIGLEFIGASTYDSLRSMDRSLESFGVQSTDDRTPYGGPAVWRIEVGDEGQLVRVPVWGKRDYSGANSKGTRGVMVWFVLESDHLYRVREPRSWRSTIEYWTAVRPDGTTYILSDQEAEEWLSAL